MFQETMEFPDIIEKEFGYTFCCDHCVYWNKVHSFGDRIHDSHNGIISRGLQEFDHEINTEHILPFIQNREQLKLVNRRVSPRFRLKAEIAGTYILANVPRHLGPLVVLEHQF